MGDVQETTGNEETSHIPVMLNEVIKYLDPKPGNIVVDGTLGLGGHAEVILKLIGSKGRLIGIDRDAQALAMASKNLSAYQDQCDFIHENYSNIDKVLAKLNIRHVDRVLLDLGLSSFQLNDPQRGFSFRAEGPLDMRMDQDSYISAFDLVNSLSEREISTILKDFGQERWHHRIARYVVQSRLKKPIETTKELSDIVLRAMPRQSRREKIHPATRAFQAFRIAVNRELEGLEEALEKCLDALKVGGRIAVVAFHSLEDRVVKQKFRKWSQSGELDLIVKKPLRPSEGEARFNPRARSARLRIAERI
ncbi:MAG: 16S rRNA (cytosine(1402)-N(4))-methyltransferase RsmH [Candidatus Omnitrophica bacterium]|nr:16S rRNA (cytosine(1402)-N(4))-methyltransferase RsmH [Candidatus Omnitrophota bacterium]